MVDAIIFDCDGVIIDSESVWDCAAVEFLRRRGFVYDRARLKPLMVGAPLAQGVRILQEAYGFSGNPDQCAEERLAIVADLFRSSVSFFPGFTDFFARVRSQHRCCVATALDRRLFAIADARLKISELFNGKIFTYDNVGGVAKPAPDLFLYAAQQLGATPERSVVIEDSPNGIEAAHRAGIRCIALSTTFGRQTVSSADFIVDRYDDIDLGLL